jgi:hypothetical protein
MYKIAVYTCIINHYDYLFCPKVFPKDIKFYCFTDQVYHSLKIKGWKLLPLSSPKSISKPNLINRYHKFFPHIVLPETDYSVYIDGNIRVISDITPLLKQFINSGATLGVCKHPQRKTIREEIDACINRNKVSDPELLFKEYEYYLSQGFEDIIDLTENNVILRKHNDEMKRVMEIWWSQLNNYSQRDQISLPYVRWKTGVKTKVFNFNARQENPYFWLYPHTKNAFFKKIKIIINLLKRDNLIVRSVFNHIVKPVYKQAIYHIINKY